MLLKKIKIYNYRQLQKVELDLQNSLTVLAGPNNSGKTTLISVLKGMFHDKKLSFTYSDIPTNKLELVDDTVDYIYKVADNVVDFKMYREVSKQIKYSQCQTILDYCTFNVNCNSN